jgi:hypothetical protein
MFRTCRVNACWTCNGKHTFIMSYKMSYIPPREGMDATVLVWGLPNCSGGGIRRRGRRNNVLPTIVY